MMIKEHKERKLIENTFNTENNIFLFYIIVSVLRLCFFIILSDKHVIVTCDVEFFKKQFYSSMIRIKCRTQKVS